MILVTGATGLLGSRLLFDLALSGKNVRAMKRSSSSMENINRYFNNHPDLLKNIEWVEGDVTDIFMLEEAFAGVTTVYHCAGTVSFIPSQREQMNLVNINGTANVVNQCLQSKVHKLCHVSSIAALGRSGDGNTIDENASWKTSNHNSSYAISKYGAEREVWRGIAEGLNAVIVNPGVIIGPGNWKTDSSMIFGQVQRGLKFYTNGVNGFVDARDVAKLMIRLVESDITGKRFIVVAENCRFRDVFDMISDELKKNRAGIYAGPLLRKIAWRIEHLRSWLTGSKPVITRETARSASGKYYYDNGRLKELFNFNYIPIEKSVKETAIFLT